MKSQLHNALRTDRDSAAQPLRMPAFTLVELMVVIVIISIVASLSLAGLGVARQKSKIDATKATIRKINEPIMDQYDSYSSRLTGSDSSALITVRRIMVEEMPDSWADVLPIGTGTTAPGRAYARYQQRSYNNNGKLEEYQSAECLFMIVARSGYEPSALENFRAAEVGDVDGDGLKEFVDSWGNPIAFARWAPGFSADVYSEVNVATALDWKSLTASYPGTPALPRTLSAIQIADPGKNHDPLDINVASPVAPFDFQMYPLVYSPGADESVSDGSGYGILTLKTGWLPPKTSLSRICLQMDSTGTWLVGAPDPSNPTAYRDNVTNHDFLGRGR